MLQYGINSVIFLSGLEIVGLKEIGRGKRESPPRRRIIYAELLTVSHWVPVIGTDTILQTAQA